LTYVYESVDPPHNLTQRTCDRILAHTDREKRIGDFLNTTTRTDSVISMKIPIPHFEDGSDSAYSVKNSVRDSVKNSVENSATIIPNRLEVLEEILAVSSCQPDMQTPDRQTTDHLDHKRLIRRSPRSSNRPNASVQISTKKSRFFGMMTSVAVGILIAVIAFPVINYVKNRTQRYLTRSTIHEINRSVDRYTQLNEVIPVEPPQQVSSQINLAQSGWQELKPAQFPTLLDETNDIPFNAASVEALPSLLKSVSSHSAPFVPSYSQSRDIILGQTASGHSVPDSFPLDPREFTDQTLMSNIDQVIPIQTAYGQNVLFQNGRIFFRILPVFTSNQPQH
jgi:hypothetical protein